MRPPVDFIEFFTEYFQREFINVPVGLLEKRAWVPKIPPELWRRSDMAPLGIIEDDGNHFLYQDSNLIYMKGTAAQGNTKTDVSWAEFSLPIEYVDGGPMIFSIQSQISGDGTNDGSSADIEVYKQDNMQISSDLNVIPAQLFVGGKDVVHYHTFAVVDTTLISGDILNLKITTTSIESGGISTLAIDIERVLVVVPSKG